MGVWEGGSEAVLEVLVRGGCVGEVPSVHCPLLQHHCVVPTYNCAVSALAIHPSTNNLVIAYSDQQVGALLVQLSWPCSLPCASLPALRAFRPGSGTWLELLVRGCCQEQTPLSCPVSLLSVQLFEFSIPEKQYTGWSRAVQSRGLHRAWLERDSPITHITFNPKNPAHILLHDTYLLCVLDKSLVSWREGWGCPGRVPVGALTWAVPALAAPAR